MWLSNKERRNLAISRTKPSVVLAPIQCQYPRDRCKQTVSTLLTPLSKKRKQNFRNLDPKLSFTRMKSIKCDINLSSLTISKRLLSLRTNGKIRRESWSNFKMRIEPWSKFRKIKKRHLPTWAKKTIMKRGSMSWTLNWSKLKSILGSFRLNREMMRGVWRASMRH